MPKRGLLRPSSTNIGRGRGKPRLNGKGLEGENSLSNRTSICINRGENYLIRSVIYVFPSVIYIFLRGKHINFSKKYINQGAKYVFFSLIHGRRASIRGDKITSDHVPERQGIVFEHGLPCPCFRKVSRQTRFAV